ncbi:hypothetical protein ACFOLD_13660 [Kocuria carniphila]
MAVSRAEMTAAHPSEKFRESWRRPATRKITAAALKILLAVLRDMLELLVLETLDAGAENMP